MAITKIYKGTTEQTNLAKIYKGNELIWEKTIPIVPYCVNFISDSPRTITPKYTNTGVTLQYSINGGSTWTNISSGEETPSAKVILFRGRATGTKGLGSTSGSASWTFGGDDTNKLNVFGNLMYLLCDSLGSSSAPTTVAPYAFKSMFLNCKSLVTPPDLSATTIDQSCYERMFDGCSSLLTAPALPATSLKYSCYNQMFVGCSSLTIPPSLPATSLTQNECYSYMFFNCTSLTTLPKLPAQAMVYNGYNAMFRNCSNIKVSTTKTGIYQYEWRIPTTGTGSNTSTAWGTDMLLGTGGTFVGTPSANTTYYVENPPV